MYELHGFASCKKTTHDSQNSLFVASVSELASLHIGRVLKIRKVGFRDVGCRKSTVFWVCWEALG